MKKRIISAGLLLVMLFQLLSVSAFAVDAAKPSPQIQKAIDAASMSESMYIAGKLVTYYFGSNYTIVKSDGNYAQIDFLDDGSVLIDGAKLSVFNSKSNMPLPEYPHSTYANQKFTWKLYDEDIDSYNIIGLSIEVACAVAAGPVNTAISKLVGEKLMATLGDFLAKKAVVVAGTIVGWKIAQDIEKMIPKYYIVVAWRKYYKDPVVTQRPETKSEVDVYHGAEEGSTKNFMFSI